MSSEQADPLDHPEVRQAGTVGYAAGYATSIILMLGALVVTDRHALSYLPFLWVIASLAVIALFAQAALFFGLGLSRVQVWKSFSLILTLPLFVLTIGLTVWMFHTLYPRTMPVMDMQTTQPTLLQ